MTDNKYSRFRLTERVIEQGKETLGVWARQSWLKELPEDRFIMVYKVTSRTEGRPDLISNLLYGTPLLDWVIISFNAAHYPELNVRGVLNWPKTGTIIKYPSDTIIFPEIV